jgi:hypothetical protein
VANNCHPPSFPYSKDGNKKSKYLCLLLLLVCFAISLSLSLLHLLEEKAMDPTNTLHNLLNKLYLSFGKIARGRSAQGKIKKKKQQK